MSQLDILNVHTCGCGETGLVHTVLQGANRAVISCLDQLSDIMACGGFFVVKHIIDVIMTAYAKVRTINNNSPHPKAPGGSQLN